MILLRTWHGIANHFPVRVSEWIMAYPALAMAAALRLQPDMFDLSPSFHALATWGDETSWSVVVLLCGTMRLVALTVNGTFHAFRYAPHLRILASVVCGLFWSQFCLGVMQAAVGGTGPWSGVVAYSTLALIELMNVYRGSADVGAWMRSVRNAGVGQP